MIKTPWRQRARAALLHLLLSLAVAALAATLVFWTWYPWPYYVLVGGTGLFVLITSVDVALGPLLTFAVFNPPKGLRKLVFDLTVIVCLQIAALIYGLHTMWVARPVALALETDRLRVVRMIDVVAEELPLAPAELRELSWLGPKLLRAEAPSDPGEQMAAIEMALAGSDLGARPKYWRVWDARARGEVLLGAKPLTELAQRLPERVGDLEASARVAKRPIAALGYLPVLATHADWIALVDIKTGDILGFAPINPY
ncbi:MAG: pilus assembly protein [Burkholderiales bacterium]|nr:MAG: pilus assembly protein [Burkholderiales bacterium]